MCPKRLPCCISEYFWESSFVQAQDDSKPWKRSTWPSYELLFWHLDKMLGAASGKWQHNFEKAEQRCACLVLDPWSARVGITQNTITIRAKTKCESWESRISRLLKSHMASMASILICLLFANFDPSPSELTRRSSSPTGGLAQFLATTNWEYFGIFLKFWSRNFYHLMIQN